MEEKHQYEFHFNDRKNEENEDNMDTEVQGEEQESEAAPPMDERTGSVMGSTGWWPSWLSWRPTSLEILADTEKSMLKPVKTRIDQRMVKINDDNYINTLKLGSGPPLVMIHGFGAAVGFWACNLDAFAKHHTVYAFDLLGFGRSSRPTVRATNAEEAEEYLVESIEQWRKSVGLNSFTLMGHSFGGYLSAAYSLKYPGRVNRLILADPWGVPKKPEEEEKAQNLSWRFKIIKAAVAWGPPLAYLRAAGPYGPGLIHRFRPDLIEKFEHLEYDKEEDVIIEESEEAEREEKRVMAAQKADSKGKLPLVTRYVYHTNAQTPPSGEQLFSMMTIPFAWAVNPMCDRLQALHPRIPVSFIYGHDTWMDPRAGYKLMGEMKNRADMYVIPRSGHHIYVDNYKYFNKVVLSITRKGRLAQQNEKEGKEEGQKGLKGIEDLEEEKERDFDGVMSVPKDDYDDDAEEVAPEYTNYNYTTEN